MRHVVLEVLLLSKGKAQKPIGKMGEMKLLGHRSMYPWFPSGMDMLGMISSGSIKWEKAHTSRFVRSGRIVG
jgi:hypothetical protein